MAQQPGRAQPKGGPRSNSRRPAAETESAFISAATELFAERGYNGTSISDLAARLGLTTASLYYHVSGKQELLLRVLDTGMAEFLDRLESIAAQDIDHRSKLRQAVENHLSFVLHHKDAVTVFLRERRFLESPYKEEYEHRVDRYDALFAGIIEDGMASEEVPAGDPHLVRLAILGMINWIVEWYEPGGRLSADEILATFADLVTERMLSAPPARRPLPAEGGLGD
ncbi:transcriptional regulator, TetR family [Modestobacter sp. DSM 44400]|uniref:TetR/AcrR family transcriptional regulator n=1 Tax=Modestobacter sp. DSM 44400 TaxID=1550230 RepID=UPI00089A9C04|nr:TetR/AcrR family transcriptional regulator [Modestobacter sp. DSM 44400]SDX99701.1 transcriptional regulator, TetR family [Modestobacter sp. DSM 44400]